MEISILNSYMDTLEKVELAALICHVPRILKSGIPIYNFEVPDTADRKMRRIRTQAIGKRFAFRANAVIANFI